MTAWTATSLPDFGASSRFQEIKDHARMAGGAEDAGNTAAADADMACYYAMAAADAAYQGYSPNRAIAAAKSEEHSVLMAAKAVSCSAFAFVKAYDPEATAAFCKSGIGVLTRISCEAELVIWEAAKEDLRRLADSVDGVQSFQMFPLWFDQPPLYLLDDWQNLRSRLIERRGEHWQVWIDWYEARLRGSDTFSASAEIQCASLANEVWKGDVASANATIAQIYS